MKNKILSWLIVMVLIVSNINAAPEQGAALQQTTNKRANKKREVCRQRS